jgi:hypothetical protein
VVTDWGRQGRGDKDRERVDEKKKKEKLVRRTMDCSTEKERSEGGRTGIRK